MKPILALLLTTAALHAEPVSLFDGKTLDGWDYDPKIWRVEDGMITGGSTTEKIKENHFICTKKFTTWASASASRKVRKPPRPLP